MDTRVWPAYDIVIRSRHDACVSDTGKGLRQ